MRFLAALVIAGAAIGCGTEDPPPGGGIDPGAPLVPGQTGVPQPVPIPDPLGVDPDLVRATGAAAMGDSEVHLFGLPGAAAGKEVLIENQRLGSRVTAASNVAGGFSAQVTAAAGDKLRLSIVDGDYVTLFEVKPQRMSVIEVPPGPIPDVDPVTVAGEGRVTVRGQSLGGGAIVGVNLDRGDTASAVTGADHRFTLELLGEGGDRLVVYNDADPLGEGWSLTVP